MFAVKDILRLTSLGQVNCGEQGKMTPWSFFLRIRQRQVNLAGNCYYKTFALFL